MLDQKLKETEDRLNRMFQGPEAFDKAVGTETLNELQPLLSRAEDPNLQRMQWANLAFLAHSYNVGVEEVEPMYEQYRGDFARQTFNHDKPTGDAEFYGMVGQWKAKRKAEGELHQENQREMFSRYRKGVGFDTAWNEIESLNASNPAWDATKRDAMREAYQAYWQKFTAFSTEHAETLTAIADVIRLQEQPVESEGASKRTEDGTLKLDRAVDLLMSMSEDEQDMALSLAAGEVSTEPTPERGAGEKALRRAFRGTEIASMQGVRGIAQLTRMAGSPIAAPGKESDFEQRMQVQMKLQQAIIGDRDIAKGDWWASEAVLGASESLPRMMVMLNPVGFAVNAAAYKDEVYSELKDRGVEREDQLQALSLAGAIPYALGDFVQAKLLFGNKVFGTSKLLGPIRDQAETTAMNLLKRAGIDYTTRVATEFAVESAQDLIAPLTLELANVIDEELPDVAWGKEWKRLGGQSPQTLGVVMVLGFIGTGAATFKDRADGLEFLRSEENLRLFGMPEPAIEKIKQAETYEQAAQVVQDNMANRETGPEQAIAMEVAEEKAAVANEQMIAPPDVDALKVPLIQESIANPETRWQYAIFNDPPMYEIQIDSFIGERNVVSTNLDAVRAQGLELPVPPRDMELGRYSIEEVREAIRKKAEAVPSATQEAIPAQQRTKLVGMDEVKAQGRSFSRQQYSFAHGPEGSITAFSPDGQIIGTAQTPQMAGKIVMDHAGFSFSQAAPEMTPEQRNEAAATFIKEQLGQDVPLDKLEEWANNVINNSLNRMYSGVDPELIAAWIVLGAKAVIPDASMRARLARNAVDNFPDMLSRMGAAFSRATRMNVFKSQPDAVWFMDNVQSYITNSGMMIGRGLRVLENAEKGLRGSDKKWIKENFKRVYEAKGETPNKRIKALADAWTEAQGLMGQKAVDLDVQISDPNADGGYRPFRRFLKETFYPRKMTATAKRALRRGKGEIYDALIQNAAIAGMNANELIEMGDLASDARRNAHLENPRNNALPETVTTARGEKVQVLSNDPLADMEAYIMGAGQRLALIEQFGQFEAEAKITAVIRELHDNGHRDAAKLVQEMWADINGTQTTPDLEFMERYGLATIVPFMERIARTAQLSGSALIQVTAGWVPIAARAGILNTVRQAIRLARPEITMTAKTKAELTLAHDLGGWTRNALGHTYSTEDIASSAAAFSGKVLKGLGVNISNVKLNQIGSVSALHSLGDAIAALREKDGGNLASRLWGMDQESIRQMLEANFDFKPAQIEAMVQDGIDYKDMLAVAKKAESDPNYRAAYFNMAQAAQRMTAKTNLFREPVTERPPWMNRKVARMFMAYMGILRALGGTMKDAMTQARRGNLKPLVTFVAAGTAGGAITKELRDILFKREDEPDEDAFEFLATVLNWQLEAGIFGLAGAYAEEVYWSLRRQQMPGTKIPLFDWWVKNVVGAGKAVSEGSVTPAYESFAKSTPIVRIADAQLGGPLAEPIEQPTVVDAPSRSSRRGPQRKKPSR